MSKQSAAAKLEVVDEAPIEDPVARKVAEIDEKLGPVPEPEIELVTITFRGVGFTIPKLMDEWQTEACLAMSEADYVHAAKILLGRGQWFTLMSLGDKRKDIREFLTAFADMVDKECIA